MSPNLAACVAFNQSATLPGWQMVDLLSSHVGCQGATGRGQGGAPFCVAHEGVTGQVCACCPPGARSQAAVTARLFITLLHGSGVLWSTSMVQEVLLRQAACAVARKPGRSQAPCWKAPQPPLVSGVP